MFPDTFEFASFMFVSRLALSNTGQFIFHNLTKICNVEVSYKLTSISVHHNQHESGTNSNAFKNKNSF